MKIDKQIENWKSHIVLIISIIGAIILYITAFIFGLYLFHLQMNLVEYIFGK